MNTVENTTETKFGECACSPCLCADCSCGFVSVSKGCDCAPCACGEACACEG